MTMDDWRRRLLELLQAERAARHKLNQHPDPAESERAYQELSKAVRDLDEHYKVRPPHT